MAVDRLRTKRNEISNALAKPQGIRADATAPPTDEKVVALAFIRLQRGACAELAVNTIIVMIAVLLGLQTLYINDLTWGSPASIMIALLWGLGLHQVAYGGIGDIVNKVAKSGSSK